MKNLIVAVAILMAASFAQADTEEDVFYELATHKVSACKAEVRAYDRPGKECAHWYEWIASERGKKMHQHAIDNAENISGNTKRRLNHIKSDLLYIENY